MFNPIMKLEIRALNKEVNKFLRQFEVDAQLGTNFNYYYSLGRIEYSIFAASEADKTFMNHFNKLSNGRIVCDIFLASLLHEVGHHLTLDSFSEEEELKYHNIVMDLQSKLDFAETEEEREQIGVEYMSLPIEMAATEWAIDYMINNAEEVGKAWKKIQRAIKRFRKYV